MSWVRKKCVKLNDSVMFFCVKSFEQLLEYNSFIFSVYHLIFVVLCSSPLLPLPHCFLAGRGSKKLRSCSHWPRAADCCGSAWWFHLVYSIPAAVAELDLCGVPSLLPLGPGHGHQLWCLVRWFPTRNYVQPGIQCAPCPQRDVLRAEITRWQMVIYAENWVSRRAAATIADNISISL